MFLLARKLGIVHCRVCNGEIDRNTTEEGKDWIMRSKGWFYHTDCYNSWVAEKDNLHASKGNEEWLDYTWEFLTKEMLMEIDFIKFKKQWESYLKKNMTAKGIYFSLKYYYDIQKAPRNKAKGGIGIVPYVYDEACQYYYALYLAQLVNQEKNIEEYKPTERIISIFSPRTYIKKRKLFNLDEEEN